MKGTAVSHTEPIQASITNTLDPGKVTAAVHQAMQKTFPAEYTPALADTIAADTITRADAATACALAWCIETGPHYDHVSADVKVIDTEGEDVIDARILHFSGSTPIVCIGQSDFGPEQAREKAGELRHLADRIDELAAHVEATTTPRA